MIKRLLWYSSVLAVLIYTSCATSPKIPSKQNTLPTAGDSNSASPSGLSETQKLLVEEAYRILGVEKLFVKGKSFSLDCSGTVMAIYWYAGIDLGRNFSKYSGGGTERIYRYLDDEGLLYKTKLPVPGDIIFWDNTYDKNGNGKPDDLLTHMGMVVTADEKGNIEYIHENYRKGIILAKMNLFKPNQYYEIVSGKKIILNDPMRMRGSPESSAGWLSGELYRNFGMGYLLK